MSHCAFDPVQILTLPAKTFVESMDCCGDHLYIGTTEGALLVHEVESIQEYYGGTPPSGCHLLIALKSFSKKPITQICVIPELQILVSLSDSVVNVHDRITYELKYQLQKTRGANLFAVEQLGGTFKLAVAIKKKIVVYHYSNSMGSFTETAREYIVSDTVKAMAWCGNNVWYGIKKGYYIIDGETAETREILPGGRQENVLLTLSPDKEILATKDAISMIFGFDGKHTRRFGLGWNDCPIAQACFPPYALGLVPKGVEVKWIWSQQSAQSLPFKGMTFMIARDSHVYVASPGAVHRLVPLDRTVQIEELQQSEKYEEALILAESLDETDLKGALCGVLHTKLAFSLFQKGSYKEAMEHFYLSGSFDVNSLLVLFPNLLPQSMVATIRPPIMMPDYKPDQLNEALDSLVTLLMQIRSTEGKFGQDDGRYIDTALLKAALLVRPDIVRPLLQSPNDCDLEESVRILKEKKRVPDLVELYRSKNMHQEALTLLKDSSKPGGPLPGIRPTIEYLQTLSAENAPLIFQFATWVLKEAPDQGLEIFTVSRNPDLYAEDVLHFLGDIDPSPLLRIPFLEWHIKHDTSSDLHNEMINLYLMVIQEFRAAGVPRGEHVPAGGETGVLGKTRKKMLQFLLESPYYVPAEIASLFPDDDLFEERAILFSRMNDHKRALRIYAHSLHDFTGALEYCQKNYDEELNKDIYLWLLEVYLTPYEESPDLLLGPAYTLLDEHYSKIDTGKALQLLPPQTEMHKLTNFFTNVFRSTTKHKRFNEAYRHLLKSEHMQVSEQLMIQRSAKLRIEDDKLCAFCGRRIGTSAIALFPDGKVMHFGCQSQYVPPKSIPR